MSRIVPVRAGMTLSELESNVTNEFFTSTETAYLPILSYWPPNTKELVTGLTTPPVIMTNDGSLRFFFLHLDAHLGMNLFVTFQAKPVTQPASQVDENPLPFTTPNQPIKHDLNQFRPPSTASSKIPSFSLFGDDDLLHDPPPQSSQPQDTDGVPPAGYDHDFWHLLLEEHLGGSDAVQVMAGIKVPKTAPPQRLPSSTVRLETAMPSIIQSVYRAKIQLTGRKILIFSVYIRGNVRVDNHPVHRQILHNPTRPRVHLIRCPMLLNASPYSLPRPVAPLGVLRTNATLPQEKYRFQRKPNSTDVVGVVSLATTGPIARSP
ncbi:unnamed protein product, partial [Brassica rapa subsp. narinosa]